MDTLQSYLTEDHTRCDALFRRAQRAVASARWNEAKQDMTAFQYALERHLLLEERIVFPAFERAIGSAVAPTAAMRSEHLRIRAVAQRLADSVAQRDTGAFVNHADALLLVLHQHSEKEEGVLYPMIERVLAHSSHKLLDAMRNFGALDAQAA